MKAQHFDILGTVVFLFITFMSFRSLVGDNPLPEWSLYILLLIGILGLIIDSSIVYNFFIKRKK